MENRPNPFQTLMGMGQGVVLTYADAAVFNPKLKVEEEDLLQGSASFED